MEGQMRRTIIVGCCALAAAGGAAAQNPEGRWQGPLDIPGRPLQLVVDLGRDSAGVWAASIIIPGLGIKGAPAKNVVVTDAGLTFDIGTALGSSGGAPARIDARLTPAGKMAGELKQGGNAAKFALERIASAQVEAAPKSTAVRGEIEGRWLGELEFGGYPRQVTITIANHAGAAATATFVVVGKQTTDLPIDLVLEQGDLVRIEAQSSHIAFDGRFAATSNEIRGSVQLGPSELQMVLRRSAREPS
jgi:hypothetical protein